MYNSKLESDSVFPSNTIEVKTGGKSDCFKGSFTLIVDRLNGNKIQNMIHHYHIVGECVTYAVFLLQVTAMLNKIWLLVIFKFINKVYCQTIHISVSSRGLREDVEIGNIHSHDAAYQFFTTSSDIKHPLEGRNMVFKTDVIDLIKGLTKRNVIMIQNAIRFPARLMEECKSPDEFIFKIKSWESYKPELFLKALQNVNPALVPLARNIPFLTTSPSFPEATDEISRDMIMFVRMLRDDITVTEWNTILMDTDYPIEKAFDFQNISRICLQEGIISRDLSFIKSCFKSVRREDLVLKVSPYQKKFSVLTDQEFKNLFMKGV